MKKILILLFPLSLFASTIYMGSGETYTDLQSAVSALSGGDTLIIRDGTYTGSTNVLNSSYQVPSGSSGNYTVIMAENDGNVFFDGEDTRNPFYLNNRSYIMFRGLVWCNSNFSGASDAVGVVNSNHIKFINCGAYDAHDGDDGHIFASYSSSYLLYEGCYVYGQGDCMFLPGRDSEKIIYRRCVVRHDRQIGNAVESNSFFAYGSRDVEFQNCIAIDADNDVSMYDYAPFAFEFRWADQGYALTNVNYSGCMAINIRAEGGFSRGSNTADTTTVQFRNCVGIGTDRGARFRYNGANLDHCTFYDNSAPSTSTWGRGFYPEGQGGNLRDSISNSIIAKIPDNIAILGGGNGAYSINNCLYDNDTNYSGTVTQTNDITTIDPIANSLLYPCRIEDGSDLDGAAADGGDVGATIVKKIGVEGTLWGEAGYDSLTNDDLWPFPNENVIRTNMRAYTDHGINGARGFCSDGETLTKYIWEYLGNKIPSDIYPKNPNKPDKVKIIK